MKMNFSQLLLAALLCSFACVAQQPDTLIKKLDSLSLHKDSTQKNNISPQSYNEYTRFTPKTYFILLADDFKQAITKPFHMKGKDWRNLGIFAASTVVLSTID